jgi:hypothetical protein
MFRVDRQKDSVGERGVESERGREPSGPQDREREGGKLCRRSCVCVCVCVCACAERVVVESVRGERKRKRRERLSGRLGVALFRG